LINLLLGDCLERLRELPDASVDACVTDPPYGISFMGRAWDHAVPSADVWLEVLRVLKPGAHLLSFFGTRTYHRGVVAIEDAGFEIRDQIGWAFSTGFPKSHDVSKAIDAALGAEREVVGANPNSRPNMEGVKTAVFSSRKHAPLCAPATPEAQQWQGWGTALKPAWEPIVVARKPLEGTVAANVLEHGTGAINVDGCRVGTQGGCKGNGSAGPSTGIFGNGLNGWAITPVEGLGRWPANLIHDGSDEVVGLFPVTKGDTSHKRGVGAGVVTNFRFPDGFRGHDDPGGSAARFFYCAKASRADREDGLEAAASRVLHRVNSGGLENDPRWARFNRANNHPTVKPTDLMRYLCRLVTPPGGVVLDPFMGSGSTGRGAVLEGFSFIGCELDPEYLEIARARIAAVSPEPEPQAPAPAGQLRLW